MRGEHTVGRVIARPFRGEPGAFERTTGRRDLALEPPGRSYLEELREAGVPVHSVGKVKQVFADVGIDEGHPGATNEEAIASTEALMADLDRGLVFANFVETDQVYGHRGDVPGFHEALQGHRRGGRRLARAPRPGAGPARPHRRPRVRPDHARLRPHARARAAAGGVRRPRRRPPRRPVLRRGRLGAALADGRRRPRAARRAVRAVRRPRASAPRGRRPRSLAGARAGLLCALVAGCGGGSSSPKAATPTPSPRAATPDPEDGDLEQLDALLGRRAARARRRPPARLRRHGDRGAANARPGGGAERPRPRPQGRRAARGLVRPRRALGQLRVLALYGVRGVRGRFATARRITARETAAGWRVVRDTSPRERHPWELGRVQARRTKHFVVLAPATLELGALTDALEGGYARMGDVLETPRLRKRYLVVVAGGAHSARALTESIRGVESLAAIADAEVQETGPAQRVTAVVSQRLVIVWPPFSTLGPDGQQRVVTHELTHAALAGDHLGPHARVARRGHRALRLRRPPGLRRRPLPRGRGGRPRAARDEPAQALEARRDRAPQRQPPGGGLRVRARRPRSTSPSGSAAAASCASTAPSTTRSCPAAPARRDRRAVRRTLGVSLAGSTRRQGIARRLAVPVGPSLGG